MGSALLDTQLESAFAGPPAAVAGSPDALRMQVAERLAAHRSRRRSSQPARRDLQTELPIAGNPRNAQIAATVAERYARSPSYRAFLAAEAERTIQQARAAAEIAALNAQAVAAAQQSLLDAFDRDAHNVATLGADRAIDPRTEEETGPCDETAQKPEIALSPEATPAALEITSQAASLPASAQSLQAAEDRIHEEDSGVASFLPAPSRLTVRLYEEASIPAQSAAPSAIARPPRRLREDRYDPEALALDDEIAFRQSPVFEEPVGPATPLPANLIEFPRQLVASRKARPRYAEGPLREEAEDPAEAQLRIFEVDPAQISTLPAAVENPAAQWDSIWLDAPGKLDGAIDAVGRADSPPAHTAGSAEAVAPLPERAGIGRRVLACAVNTMIVGAGVVASSAAFLLASEHSMLTQSHWHMGPARIGALMAANGLQPATASVACAAAGAFLYLLYQSLFLSFHGATPGMRCARIALCTFDGGNPSRRAMRRRMLAALLSAAPLGLGFFWATLDEDRLTWHDRITRVYPRRY
jgi:uncharacterized RDD family membrane protein YckC